MHGLNYVPATLGKRIRCLPICPPGTCGRILARRLAHSTVAAEASSASISQKLRTTPPTADEIEALMTWRSRDEELNTGGRANSEIAQAAERAIQARIAAKAAQAPKPLQGPLDSKITGLTVHVPEIRDPTVRELLVALARGDNSGIWHYFMKTRSEGKLGQLRHSDFSAVLRSIQAAGYVSIQNRHKLLDSGHAIMLTEDAAFKEVKRKLQFVMWNMRWNGHHLSSSDYFHVLDCARQGDDVEFAEDVWNRLAGDTRVAANVWHYNSYMATVCGTSKTERWSRINDETLKRRTSSEEKNPRNKALVLLSRMTNRGVWPNSMTFDLVIMAAGKLGDMKRVRATLLKAWGVDVSNLPEDDIPEAERETSVRLPDDSPTYPTIHTLLAVAVTFGSNGHVDDAFRIVDYMSKRFNLEITRPTWIALLNWAYTSTFTKASDQTVPPTALVNIWTSMVSAPYNIRPTIEMHDYLVRSYLWRSMPDAAEGAMYSGLSLLASAYRQLERSEARLRALVADPRSRAHALSAERTALALAQRNIFRGRSIIRRWAELLALGHEQEMNVGFARTRIPDIVQNWGTFLGDGVVYFVQGGYVHLELGEARRWEPMMIRRRRREPWPLGTGAKEEDDLF